MEVSGDRVEKTLNFHEKKIEQLIIKKRKILERDAERSGTSNTLNNEIKSILTDLSREGLNENSIRKILAAKFFSKQFRVHLIEGDSLCNEAPLNHFQENNIEYCLNLEDRFFKELFPSEAAIKTWLQKKRGKFDFAQLNLKAFGRLIVYLEMEHDELTGMLVTLRNERIPNEPSLDQLLHLNYLLWERREKVEDTYLMELEKLTITKAFEQLRAPKSERFEDVLAILLDYHEKKQNNLSVDYKLTENQSCRLEFFSSSLELTKPSNKYGLKLMHTSLVYKQRKRYLSKETQLLRHVSKLLYFRMIPCFVILQEVQIMLVSEVNKIGENPNLKKLQIAYSPLPNKRIIFPFQNKTIGEIISDKSAVDLSVIKDPEWQDELQLAFNHSMKRYCHLTSVCNKMGDNRISQLLKKITDTSLRSCIVNPEIKDGYFKKHAEEHLCDVADRLRIKYPAKLLYFKIYGRKRPCTTCAGRMYCAKIDEFNKNSGLMIRLNFLEQLKKHPCAALESLLILLTKPSQVTFPSSSLSSSYDTESEDEEDED